MIHKGKIIQRHHMSYDPEITVRMYHDEHFYLSKLQRFNPTKRSKGFLTALEFLILSWKTTATDLDRYVVNQELKELKELKRKTKKQRH